MKNIFYLKTCDTCKRILKQWSAPSEFEMREIKSQPISEVELSRLRGKVGSYLALLNKRSQKLKLWNIDVKSLDEDSTRELILKDYTLLIRPILEDGDMVFAGNAKRVVESATEHLMKP